MKIEAIIYDTTRELVNLEEKLRIATIFLFCEKLGSQKLSEFIYSKNHEAFIEGLNEEYQNYHVDFTINFSNSNIASAFHKTLEKVKEKWDSDKFLKAISEGDEFALAICEIVNYDFDKVQIIEIKKEIDNQLSFWN